APMRECRLLTSWGCSSIGRAFDWQSKGSGFESRQLHQTLARRRPRNEGVSFLLALGPCGDCPGDYWASACPAQAATIELGELLERTRTGRSTAWALRRYGALPGF